ncbi:MAG: DNA polymerase I [Akkermansia sp.]|nr:DNA polymerase I [Akkermansia sp.]
MDTFCILDGMALIYRAFYAFINNPMRNSAGLNTSAMFGFINTVVHIIEKEQPSHIVACLDPSGPTFRHERFADYKANRQAMPQELRDSIPWIADILAAMRITTVRLAGYEADDLIGTFTRLADERGSMKSLMVSKDKDLGQLFSATCSMLRPGKKGSDFEHVSQDTFLEEWGISSPAQIIDILALMGDASDNIPGVPGVGAKTAQKLIQQFGSVESLLSRTAEIKGKMREKIESNADNARLSYELATIRRDVPLPVSIDDCVRREFDTEALREILRKLEFRSLADRLCGKEETPVADTDFGELFAASAPSPEAAAEQAEQLDLFASPQLTDINSTPHHYRLITTEPERRELADKLASSPRWAFDTETTGLDPLTDKLLGVSFCITPHEACYVPVADGTELEVFRTAFAGNAEKAGLNLKFDLQVLRHAGLQVEGPFFDVMLAHCALYPELRHNMDAMAEALLNYRTVHLEDIAGKGNEMNTAAVPQETMADYAAEDADITLQLADILLPRLKESGQEKLMREIEFPLVPVLADIEYEGMRVEPQQLQAASAELGQQIEALRESIDAEIGHPINLNSPKQLGDLLFGEMKLLAKPKKTRTGQFVTDEETLRKLVPISPLVGKILEYRELTKLKGTYLDALPRYISPADGRIHSTLQQMLTATGRLASQSPNLQNIPVRSEAGKLIRRAFVARDTHHSILSADYSQVELRLMAALSGDPAMVAAFREGRDIHAETAARIYGVPHEQVTADMRRAAKTVNFGIIYGISAFGLSQRLDCPRSTAAALIESYFEQFPLVKECMDKLISEARERGYAETLCGRIRRLPDISSSNFNLRTAAERTAINTPIQGTAADMIKIAMIRVAELLRGKRSRLIMQIHDELLIDLHEDEHGLIPQITAAMQQALPLPNAVPLEVEANTAPNWLQAH